jgi:aminopeptidase-like protein
MEKTEQEEILKKTEVGKHLHGLIERLYPICRSITGDGVRQTLSIISEYIPLKITDIPSGTKVYDWEIPLEWNIKDAWIKNNKGEKIVDFKKSSLHVLNYSIPVSKTVTLEELKEHLFTLPDQPDKVPYKTSYYVRNWGFCLSHNQFITLEEGDYEVSIDSTLNPGSLTYGEFFIQGKTNDEVLISTHICHPSLCNDNLSGIAISTFIAKSLSVLDLRYSYRFLFIPTTIGSIAWLNMHEKEIKNIKYGLVLTLLGDTGKFNYKKTRSEDAKIDRIVENVLRHSYNDFGILNFSPEGYDERQYNSPGINLPVGRLTRSLHTKFPEYHNSGDNLEFVKSDMLAEAYELVHTIMNTIEGNRTYLNLNPKGEPLFQKRIVYDSMADIKSKNREFQVAMLWVLNLSDGGNSLLDISERSGIRFDHIQKASGVLFKIGLIKELIQ